MISGTHVESVLEIPEKTMRILSVFEYEELLRPIIIGELQRGKSRKNISERWGVTQSLVRNIGEKYKLFPRKRWAANSHASNALY